MKTLIDCIRSVESSNNPDAMRFESTDFNQPPGWIAHQVSNIQAQNACNETTALAIATTSWGFYQILGANIYDLGCKTNIITWVLSINSQQATFEDFIKPYGFYPDEDISTWDDARFNAFAAFYNGPGDTSNYVTAMKATTKAAIP